MVNAPKELWPINFGGCLVFLDEADLFAPEKRESEALSAVIDMAGRGRKRGYCLIPATRRPAQLNKDVSAECNNKLIGRASLDIDRKRSAEELGFTTKEQILSLRNLEPGKFYTFGPAISREVVKTVIGDVHVKPPKSGMGVKATPPPTEKVRKILSRLADLPAEAIEEARTSAELKAEKPD
jgi:DNA helicase HerA-like ATPase